MSHVCVQKLTSFCENHWPAADCNGNVPETGVTTQQAKLSAEHWRIAAINLWSHTLDFTCCQGVRKCPHGRWCFLLVEGLGYKVSTLHRVKVCKLCKGFALRAAYLQRRGLHSGQRAGLPIGQVVVWACDRGRVMERPLTARVCDRHHRLAQLATVFHLPKHKALQSARTITKLHKTHVK